MSLSRPRRGREEEERDGGRGGGGGEGSTPAKRPRGCSCSCCVSHRETKDFYEAQIEILKKEMRCMSKGFKKRQKYFQTEMQQFYQNQLHFMGQISERMEQFNTLISGISTPGDHVRENSNLRAALSHHGEVRTYRLKFVNRCCKPKYSRKVIKADDGNPIMIAIYDHHNKIIKDGPLSLMQVKIVVVEGEFNKENKEQWSKDSFLKNIVKHGRPGKPLLFDNDPFLRLENGVASLGDFKFQDNVPGKKFRLGVMAADGNIPESVQEGISDSFIIMTGRSFPIKKDSDPSLTDPIYKLKKIAGVRQKKLEGMDINLVQDFLLLYNIDKNNLRKACGNIILDHDWDIIVAHALSCKQGKVFYSYYIPEMDATIFFNSLYDIVGAKFNGKYTTYEKLDDTQKKLVEASKTKAYANLEVVQCEDKSSSHETHLIVGDSGRCYLAGSCSTPPISTLQTRFPDEGSYQSEASESRPAQESPRYRQHWMRMVSTATALHFWRKSAVLSWVSQLMSTPPRESYGMTDDNDMNCEPALSATVSELSSVVLGDEA